MNKMMIVCAAALSALVAMSAPAADCGCAQPGADKACDCGKKPECDCGKQESCGCEKGKCPCKQGDCEKGKCSCKKGDCKKGKCRPRPLALRLTPETTADDVEAFKRQVAEKIDAVFARSRDGAGEARTPVAITLIVNDRPGKGPQAKGARPGRGKGRRGEGPRRHPRCEGGEAGEAEAPVPEQAED